MNKHHISRLAAIMVSKGIEQVVVSPGSRNAPAIILFGAQKKLRLLSVADERSAAFFALGIAWQTGKTVALLCTSGSAVLNYAPALAEAYYQKIPLLVITADRPVEWTDQGDGQTIRQQNIYANYIRKSYHLPLAADTPTARWFFDRMVNEAIDRTRYPACGPVHINLPVDEPLYDLDIKSEPPEIHRISYIQGQAQMTSSVLEHLAEIWKDASAKMILIGQMNPDENLHHLLREIAVDPTVIVLTECTSNLADPLFINCIDRTIAQVGPSENSRYRPEVLLSIGGAVVSKKVKAMLRSMNPAHHWHVNPDTDDFHFDTYQSLTATIALQPHNFLQQLLSKATTAPVNNPDQMPDKKSSSDRDQTAGTYSALWQNASRLSAAGHAAYLNRIPFSDFTTFKTIIDALPTDSAVHLANSTPVRYGQLFDHSPTISFYANRGTSGIDGCVSTAAGFALNYSGHTVVITGDIAFLYDSNSLWNANLNPNLRIILVNNGGGNIFRIIDGPSNFEELEPFMETRHDIHAAGIAANFNIPYYKAQNEQELSLQLPLFFGTQQSNRPALLEVITDHLISAEVLRNYFRFLREHTSGNFKSNVEEKITVLKQDKDKIS